MCETGDEHFSQHHILQHMHKSIMLSETILEREKTWDNWMGVGGGGGICVLRRQEGPPILPFDMV